MISLSIIGTGNVAFHLAKAFNNAQHLNLQFVAGRNYDHLALFNQFASTTTSIEKTQQSDVIIIAVSDDAIIEVSQQLSPESSLIVHTSGSTEMKILSNHNRYGVFYPLQSFSKLKYLDYSKIPFLIEAKLKDDFAILNTLGNCLNAKTYAINSAERAALHLAAVFSNNFSNHILTEAKSLCKENKVAFELLKPLMEETIKKAFELGPENSQTGPAKRGDTITLKKQLENLKTTSQKNIYTTLTKAIQKSYE